MTSEQRQALRELRDQQVRARIAASMSLHPKSKERRQCKGCEIVFWPRIYNQAYCTEECRKETKRIADRHRQTKTRRSLREQAA